VGKTGGERSKGDQRIALPRSRLDGPRGLVQPLDEVAAEREPGVGELAQHLGRHPEHPPGAHRSAGREIDAVLVPGAEPASPTAGCVHLPDDDVLAADVADQVDGTLDQHPPEVRMLALVEQVEAGLDVHLAPALDELSELVVSEPVEEVERAQVVDAHQIVAR